MMAVISCAVTRKNKNRKKKKEILNASEFNEKREEKRFYPFLQTGFCLEGPNGAGSASLSQANCSGGELFFVKRKEEEKDKYRHLQVGNRYSQTNNMETM